jgi:hypothetical protein
MFLLGLACFYYFQKERNLPFLLSLSIAVATVTNPALVFLATSTLMSECVFILLQLAVILVIERYTKISTSSKIPYLVVLGGILASSAFLTRTIGIVIIASVVLFLLSKRLWASVIIFVFTVALCLLPWMIYKKITFPKNTDPLIEKQYGVTNYNDEFWKSRAGSSEKITIVDLPKRFLKNINEISGLNIGGMLFPSSFRGAKESGEEVLGMTGVIDGNFVTRIFSFTFALIAFVGFLLSVRQGVTLAELIVSTSFMLIIAWPWLPFRFVLALFPFLLFYILTTFYHLHMWLIEKKNLVKFNDQWLFAKVFFAFLIIFNIYDHLGYIQSAQNPQDNEKPQWIRIHKAQMEMFDWINKNGAKDSVIVSDNPSLVFLYTGKKTLVVTERDFRAFNVKYLVKTEITPPSSTILGTSILGKKLVYNNPDFNLMVLEVK